MPSESGFVPPVRVELLGGFRVERIGSARPVVWQRRTARTLTKLLAAHPRHSLHREEILELLWPGVPAKSALNRFGQALHAARRAFEPELLPRKSSAYLRLTESMLSLETEHVIIDADLFQQLAESALGRGNGNEEAYESALAAYGGELLPEDRYHDWCAERRAFLAELRIRLLVELADALEERGAQAAAADRLRETLRYDPTREDVHRRLIMLYAVMGSRDQAVRQFQMCREVLQRDLGVLPAESTLALYEEILADRTPKRIDAPAGDPGVVESHRVAAAGPTRGTPMIGRDSVSQHPRGQLKRAGQGVATGLLTFRVAVLQPLREQLRRAGKGVATGLLTFRVAVLQPLREQLRRAGKGEATGLLIFRIAWVTAILVSALVFLVGLFSGSDSSRQTAEVALAPPAPVVAGRPKRRLRRPRLQGRRTIAASGPRSKLLATVIPAPAYRVGRRLNQGTPVGWHPWSHPTRTPAGAPAEALTGTAASSRLITTRPPGTGPDDPHRRQQQHRTALGGRNNNDGPDVTQGTC